MQELTKNLVILLQKILKWLLRQEWDGPNEAQVLEYFFRIICHDDPKSSEEKKPGFLVDDDDGSD